MRHPFIFLFFLVVTYNCYAQIVTGFNNITDVDGNVHSLSNYLADDKFVLLNFYLETCGNCMATAPKIQSIYNDFGQNQCQLIIFNMIVQNSPPYYTDQECITWMTDNGCPGPPNFSNQNGIDWGQFYSVHGGSFAQSYLITPLDNSVVFSHAGGVLDDMALRSFLNNNITLGAANTSSSTITSCDSYDWNGQIYSVSGSYNQTFSNTSGCDSLHTLSLTINNSNSGFASYSSPNPVIWAGQTLTSSGLYTANLTNIFGCDSIANLDFTLNPASITNENRFNINHLVKIIDPLGRDCQMQSNKTLFYIYNDGSVNKRIIIE